MSKTSIAQFLLFLYFSEAPLPIVVHRLVFLPPDSTHMKTSPLLSLSLSRVSGGRE